MSMTREEAVTYGNELIQCSTGLLREFAELATRALRQPASGAELHIVFDGPPGPEAGRFVEVETAEGESINAGEWRQVGDYWHLVTRSPARGGAEEMRERAAQVCDREAALYLKEGDVLRRIACHDCATEIRALPTREVEGRAELDAEPVPEAVRAWCEWCKKFPDDMGPTDTALRAHFAAKYQGREVVPTSTTKPLLIAGDKPSPEAKPVTVWIIRRTR